MLSRKEVGLWTNLESYTVFWQTVDFAMASTTESSFRSHTRCPFKLGTLQSHIPNKQRNKTLSEGHHRDTSRAITNHASFLNKVARNSSGRVLESRARVTNRRVSPDHK